MGIFNDQQIKIGIVTPRYPPNARGGGEINAQLLAEQLAQRADFQVEIHSFDGDQRENINDIPVIHHRNTSRIPELAPAIGIYNLFGPVADLDVIHGYNMELHPAIGLPSEIRSVAAVEHLNLYI